MGLIERIKKVLGLDSYSFLQSSSAVQQELAPKLRKEAIEHLKSSNEPVAKSFRGEYNALGNGEYNQFLSKQGKSGQWATYIEASALAESLDCNLVVTPVTRGIKKPSFSLYNASKGAPTIHLYNSDNTHWYFDASTKGSGNCLYNAFAQALQKEVLAILNKPLALFSTTSSKNSKPAHQRAVQRQCAIAASIGFFEEKDALDKTLLEEQKRISQLSSLEQEQIRKDYLLAMELASEDSQLKICV